MNDLSAVCGQLSKTYRSATEAVDALLDVDAAFPRESVTTVVGPSGSGKTSLLKILAGLDRPTSGWAKVDGVDIGTASRQRLTMLRRRVGYVFQRPADNVISYLLVVEHVRLTARLRGVGPEGIEEILAALGLTDRRHHLPHQLSGGEQQRLAVGQAALGDPVLILADEPTAQLDPEAASIIREMIRALTAKGSTLVVASHDPSLVGAADEVVTLRNGRRVEMRWR